MNVTRFTTVIGLSISAAAFGQSFNIEFGSSTTGPPPTYAAAGLPGVWNNLLGTNGVTYPVVDINGNATNVTVKNIGGTSLVSSDDPSTSGSDEALLDDYLVTFNPSLEVCLFFTNLQSGTYEVTTYAWTPNMPELQSFVTVDFSPPGQIVGGAWTGQHEQFVTFGRHMVTVTSGTIGGHSGILIGEGNLGALSAVQLRRVVPNVNIASANPPLDNPYVDGQQPFVDVLDTGSGGALTAGIGGADTQAQGAVEYAAVSVAFSGTPSPIPAPYNILVECTGGACPSVAGVTGSGVGPYAITLTAPIPPGECTTLTFAGNVAQKLQYQSQPGNVSMDASTNTQDLLALILALNSGTANDPANLARYNVNRSAGENPVNTQDLLRVIQLLNGVNTTQPFNGATVGSCP